MSGHIKIRDGLILGQKGGAVQETFKRFLWVTVHNKTVKKYKAHTRNRKIAFFNFLKPKSPWARVPKVHGPTAHGRLGPGPICLMPRARGPWAIIWDAINKFVSLVQVCRVGCSTTLYVGVGCSKPGVVKLCL